MSEQQTQLRFLAYNATGFLKQLFVVNLFLQLFEGWLSYRVSIESLAEKYSLFFQAEMTRAALQTLICNKTLVFMLLLSIVWLGNKRPRLATQALIVTASVSVVFFVDHLQQLLG